MTYQILHRSTARAAVAAFAVTALAPGGAADAAILFASGQLLTPGDPSIPDGSPGHDDRRDNFIYSIDTATGLATPASPSTTGLPSALAGSIDGRLLGFAGGRLREVNPATGATTPIGPATGLNSTGFDVLSDGRGVLLPFDTDFETQQLHRIDLATSAVTPVGSASAVGDAIDAARGTALGTAEPFVIGLGSVGPDVYGVDLDTLSLIRLDPDTGAAAVVGDVGAVDAVGPGLFSGFAALTGADEDGDGTYDTLYGGVNFLEAEGAPFDSVRLGGIARFDLGDGSFDFINVNPGVIFFGLGSPVPEPASLAMAGVAGLALRRRRRRPDRR